MTNEDWKGILDRLNEEFNLIKSVEIKKDFLRRYENKTFVSSFVFPDYCRIEKSLEEYTAEDWEKMAKNFIKGKVKANGFKDDDLSTPEHKFKWEEIEKPIVPREKKRFSVAFQYYMNMPEIKHDRHEEVMAYNNYGAQVEIEKKYPNTSKFVITEVK